MYSKGSVKLNPDQVEDELPVTLLTTEDRFSSLILEQDQIQKMTEELEKNKQSTLESAQKEVELNAKIKTQKTYIEALEKAKESLAEEHKK